MAASNARTTSASRQAFENTLWSRVIAAASLDSKSSRPALEELCRLYWYPIYAFLRRWGKDRQAARDLAQGFFEYFLGENLIRKADPDRGRFRSFLLGILQHFVAKEATKQMAIKRGGGSFVVSIDEETAEGQYLHEPFTNLTPEKLFERRWALAVLNEAVERLRQEYDRARLSDLFTAMQPYLTGDAESSFAELGERLNKTEGAARVLVCRFRNRFRQLIRAVIADTVSDLDQVEEELKHLQSALREH